MWARIDACVRPFACARVTKFRLRRTTRQGNACAPAPACARTRSHTLERQSSLHVEVQVRSDARTRLRICPRAAVYVRVWAS
eukprot:6184694-Pleurochrysis_carterae.AAC.3